MLRLRTLSLWLTAEASRGRRRVIPSGPTANEVGVSNCKVFIQVRPQGVHRACLPSSATAATQSRVAAGSQKDTGHRGPYAGAGV